MGRRERGWEARREMGGKEYWGGRILWERDQTRERRKVRHVEERKGWVEGGEGRHVEERRIGM